MTDEQARMLEQRLSSLCYLNPGQRRAHMTEEEEAYERQMLAEHRAKKAAIAQRRREEYLEKYIAEDERGAGRYRYVVDINTFGDDSVLGVFDVLVDALEASREHLANESTSDWSGGRMQIHRYPASALIDGDILTVWDSEGQWPIFYDCTDCGAGITEKIVRGHGQVFQLCRPCYKKMQRSAGE